jgi:hypothetical protein
MAAKDKADRLRVIRRISSRPMPEENRRVAEELLGKFIARAFISDHLELFRRRIPVPAPAEGTACRIGSSRNEPASDRPSEDGEGMSRGTKTSSQLGIQEKMA